MNRDYQIPLLSQENQAKSIYSGAKTFQRSRKKCSVSLKRPYAKRLVHRHLPLIMKLLTKSELKVLNWFYTAETTKGYPYICYAQKTIAKECNLSIDTVSEAIRLFCGLNMIKSNYNHMRTCVYVLSNLFYQKNHRATLRKFLTTLALVLAMGTSVTTKVLSSSSSSPSLISMKSRNRDYSAGAQGAQKLGNSPKDAIMKLYGPLGVCPDGMSGRKYLGIVARRLYMETEFKKLHLAIKSITEIDLSLYGRCELTIFTPEAIQNARWNMRNDILSKKTINDPFTHFFSLCTAASLKRGERMDYTTYNLLRNKYSFEEGTPKLNSKILKAEKLRMERKAPYKEFKTQQKQHKTVEELEREYLKVTNNVLLQTTWKAMPAIKEAWLSSFNAQMNSAKEREQDG